MPKPRVLLGLRLPRISPRRISFLLVSLGLFALFTLIFTVPSAVPAGPSLSKFTDHKFSIPKLKNTFSSSILNPFRPVPHAPPVQKNSTDGESKWHSGWNWLSPFSSSVTLDEGRSLLPPVAERTKVYCYYDTSIQRDPETRDAESELLLTWRRAWWSKGFKPIILSQLEAMNNPMYNELQRLEVEPSFKTDMMRWLAWESMNGGILAHHLLFPMGPNEDPLLAFLRRGEFPKLSRWDGLDEGLYAGAKPDIAGVIGLALKSPQLKSAKDVASAVTTEAFVTDTTPKSIAYYNAKTVEKQYKKVGEEISAKREAGLRSLNAMINSHLHIVWREVFSDGIAVLKPLPHHTTHMIQPARQLANFLAQCGDTPLPSSCPPNLPKCAPCVSSHPMKISTPAIYRNASTLYTIGTVPHPVTLVTLSNLKENIDVPWIRRNTERDPWLTGIMKELMGTGMSGAPRLVKFKTAVAGDYATAHSIWLTGEHEVLPPGLDWRFGFKLVRNASDDGKSETPVPGPERRPKPEHDPNDGAIPSEADLAREPELLKKARTLVMGERDSQARIRAACEAWNLADTEAWRFAKAFLARARVERKQWEEEESKYAGGAGIEKEDGHRGW